MESEKKVVDDEGNTSLELPALPAAVRKPGFAKAKEKSKDASQRDDRFPRLRDKKDVPQEPLSRRIAKQR
jgi:hypothetical protein